MDDPHLVRRIGRIVQRERTARSPRLSAQALCDAAAELGIRVPRSTIADIENGRRRYVTVGELLAFAAVLDIPVAELVPEVSSAGSAQLATMRWRLDAVAQALASTPPRKGSPD